IPSDDRGSKYAFCEPIMDYIAVKFPKWPFDKFIKADKRLGTKMKATGEVMAIAPSIEEGLLKAVRSLELGIETLELPYLKGIDDERLLKKLFQKTDERLFIVAECMRRNMPLDTMH